ncbi:MAG: hypothetical protein HY924_17155 [Elusimicrobia bacterium]|nr:hypothetical protein [Elusimicrobiota bacterium]
METRVSRSWKHTLLLGGAGLGLTVWAGLILAEGGSGWGVAIGLAGLFCLAGGILLGGHAPCPTCGETLAYLSSVMTTTYNKCPGCGDYFRCEAGELRAIAPDHVADEPQFSIPLPESSVMPGLCCHCGAPASERRTLSLGIRLVESPASLTAREATLSLEVPCCGRHQDGAKLDREAPEKKLDFENLVVGVRNDPVTVLKVRSHAFYLAFREANKK